MCCLLPSIKAWTIRFSGTCSIHSLVSFINPSPSWHHYGPRYRECGCSTDVLSSCFCSYRCWLRARAATHTFPVGDDERYSKRRKSSRKRRNIHTARGLQSFCYFSNDLILILTKKLVKAILANYPLWIKGKKKKHFFLTLIWGWLRNLVDPLPIVSSCRWVSCFGL